MNISTVAREAGISVASIHNTYPDVAEAIRAKAGKSSRSAFDAERFKRKRLVELLRLARERVRAMEKDLIRIASENARLVAEIAVLNAKLASRHVVDLVATLPRAAFGAWPSNESCNSSPRFAA